MRPGRLASFLAIVLSACAVVSAQQKPVQNKLPKSIFIFHTDEFWLKQKYHAAKAFYFDQAYTCRASNFTTLEIALPVRKFG
jgi:hypothetical protein